MKMFKSLKSAIHWVENLHKFHKRTTLDYLKSIYQTLKIELNCKKIHIAGTNGKGSVAAMTTSILVSSGFKVGTFISPYVLKFNERIKINNQNINDKLLLASLNKFYFLNENLQNKGVETLSFFEVLTLMCFDIFSNLELDYIVIECGIGGLLDATNILKYDFSCITSVGYDHMNILGNTLEMIALNKLGILKDNGVLIANYEDDLEKTFEGYAKSKNAILYNVNHEKYEILSIIPNVFKYQNNTYEVSLIGEFQIKNAILVLKLVSLLNEAIIVLDTIKIGLLKAANLARFQIIRKEPLVIIDAAHNVNAIYALFETLKKLNKNIYVIFSSLKDKDIQAMLDIIKLCAKEVYLTSFPDARFSLFSPEILIENSFFTNIQVCYQYALTKAKPCDIIIITGSLHFAAYAIKKLAKFIA